MGKMTTKFRKMTNSCLNWTQKKKKFICRVKRSFQPINLNSSLEISMIDIVYKKQLILTMIFSNY